jgi:hypothetical protein
MSIAPGIADNLKTEEHGGRETVHLGPGHVAGRTE